MNEQLYLLVWRDYWEGDNGLEAEVGRGVFAIPIGEAISELSEARRLDGLWCEPSDRWIEPV